MTVICGTDFSPAAAAAANVAALVARRLGRPLILLYALDELADFRVDPKALRAYESVFDLAKQRLPAEAERLRAYGATVEEVFVTGAADEALVHHANTAGARLIVLASTGRRRGARWLLGSVAERTLRTSQIPVLVLRVPASIEAWLGGERSLRVIVGTDLSAISEPAIRWATALRGIGPCRITIVHATRADADAARALERDLRRQIQEICADTDVDASVRSAIDRPGRYLARIAATEQADLLVVGSRQRTGIDRFWHGTVAGEASHLADTNVAYVPALAPEDRRAEPIREIRTVLAATDFSRLGNAAVPYAYSLVAAGGVVHLVHVLQPPRFQSTVSLSRPELAFTLETASEHHLAAQLAALVPDDARQRGIVSQLAIIEHRDVGKGICGAATRRNVDAICMGFHGRPWPAEAVAGSIARGVASRTTVPVVLVPPAVRSDERD